MKSSFIILNLLLSIVILFSISCAQNEIQEVNKNSSKNTYKLNDIRKLSVLNSKLGEAHIGDWLYYKDEPGQSFKEYINSQPIVPSSERNKIYILPIGEFSEIEYFVITETAVFMNKFFGLDVVLKKKISSSIIPKSAQRINFGIKQLHTKYILKKILLKSLPDDAVAFIAITSDDLYPEDDWNFVFGQASIKKRVGVSSIFRLTYDNLDTTNYQLFLKRIAETTTHETCHMFSMKHCIEYKCMMNGSMHLEEADSKPLHLCPECLAKLTWCTNYNMIQRFEKLNAYFEKHNFPKESEYCLKAKEIIEQ